MRVFIFTAFNAVGFVALACIVVFSGCAFNAHIDEENVRIVLPAVSEFPVLGGFVRARLLVYTDKNGIKRELMLKAETSDADIRVPKNGLTPVLCYLLSDTDSVMPGKKTFFKPAGAIYPVQAKGIRKKTLHLNWKDAFAADFLLQLTEGADLSYGETVKALSYVNWERFLSETRKHDNPWHINRQKLLHAVTAQRINVYSFSAEKQTDRTVVLPYPTEKLFFSYIPDGFLLPLFPDPEAKETEQKGHLFTLPLHEGVNTFVSPDFIVNISEENGGKRLVISTIPYYTE